MSKFWKSLSIASAAVGVSIAASGAAQAAPANTAVLDQLSNYSQEGQTNSVAQVNSVFQLRDVAPSDWAFDALRNLVEKYNCIVGYPDGTFRGNHSLSRYEFAAGLNACMQQIEKLVAGGGSDVDPADIARLRKLVQEFQAELATLGARVDDLDGRVGFLESHQFSTTTKLKGEVIFGLTDSFGDTGNTFTGFDINGNPTFKNDDTTEATLSDRVRLTLETSFTGKDKLITRLTAGNSTSYAPSASIPVDTNGDGFFDTIASGGGVGALTSDNTYDGGNNVTIDWLAYYFPLKKANAYVAAAGGLHTDYVSTTFGAKGMEDFGGGSGALTNQASSSPIYTIGGGAGVGLNFPAGPVDVSLGYLAANGSDPSQKNGLFNGEYAALAQIAVNLGKRAELGFTYVNSYHNTNPIYNFGGSSAAVGTYAANGLPLLGAVEANSYGVEGKFDLSDKVSLAAYGMMTDANFAVNNGFKNPEIWSYGLGASFSDVGKKGNVLGLFAGVPPYVGGSNGGKKTPLQIEGFYKYQLNDSISITPGVIWLSHPAEGAASEDSAVIGTVRTTFKF